MVVEMSSAKTFHVLIERKVSGRSPVEGGLEVDTGSRLAAVTEAAASKEKEGTAKAHPSGLDWVNMYKVGGRFERLPAGSWVQ